jgi:metallo-beta-lactamase family protein
MHPECFDAEARELLQSGQSPFDLEGLRYVSDREESMAIDTSHEPCVIISASGMCEAGRVLHHLKAAVEGPENTIVIVGFQAQHTLGRRIVERRPMLRILGVDRRLAAHVVVMNGFSAHGDQSDLVGFVEKVAEQGPLRNIVLVHGERGAQDALKAKLIERGFPTVHVPASGDVLEL